MLQWRRTSVTTCEVGVSDWFQVEVGLHQGSALSTFFVAIMMDCLIDKVRMKTLWSMMYADDIVICSEIMGAGGGNPGEVETVCSTEKRNKSQSQCVCVNGS